LDREGGDVHDDLIDSVNRGGSVQLDSFVSASHVLGAIDSSQESQLVATMSSIYLTIASISFVSGVVVELHNIYILLSRLHASQLHPI
jgi:hypothetical protein